MGRAAIIGWRDVLAPALEDPDHRLRIWPFHGRLPELLASGWTVAAETYPAEACVQLGFDPPGRGWSKRRWEDRASRAGPILDWASLRGVSFDPDLRRQLEDGFGRAPGGDDPFDALLGTLSLIEVAGGFRGDGVPDDPSIIRVEGWILGQGGAR